MIDKRATGHTDIIERWLAGEKDVPSKTTLKVVNHVLISISYVKLARVEDGCALIDSGWYTREAPSSQKQTIVAVLNIPYFFVPNVMATTKEEHCENYTANIAEAERVASLDLSKAIGLIQSMNRYNERFKLGYPYRPEYISPTQGR